MHDLVMRGGLLVDGTGNPPVEGDVAIDGERITAVGPNLGPGRREIDARGMVVAPGWVDIHTHYDGQATWDPYMTPSSWHGVTTVVMGNCGVGFAPARPDKHQWLIGLMEGVEDIPGTALAEGITWSWQSFPEYLDALERMPRVLDIGTQVPHGAVRAYVMRVLRAADAVAERRGRLAPHIAARPPSILMGLQSSIHPFSLHRGYHAVADLPLAERVARLRSPEVRAAILAERIEVPNPLLAYILQSFHKLFPLGDPPDYEPGPERSVQAIAGRDGRSPHAVA